MKPPASRNRRAFAFLACSALALGLGGTGIATAQPLDDRLAAVADDVPSFAGMFVNQGAGVLHVYLADPGPHAPARAEETLRHVFAAQRLPGRVKVHTGRFSFRRLDAWHGRLSARVLGIRGVVLTDVDDAEDRLTVGVRNRASRARVKRRLGTLAIPREAVAIERMAPIEAEVTLRSRRRPLVGGMQIASRISSSDQFLCTLGFNAIRAGVRGYVTNSHCTRSQGGAESTVFHQPTSFTPGNKIGVEAIDRPYFTGGACPATRRCRYSDTAFVRRDPPGVRVSQGRIAAPSFFNTIEWDPSTRVYRLVSEGDAVVGNVVRKVGRTTGMTRGRVTRTCANIRVADTNITLLCQSQATYRSAGGDSGSPVFTRLDAPQGLDSRLRGIHWGSGGTFSPISGIQRPVELGAIRTCAAPFGC